MSHPVVIIFRIEASACACEAAATNAAAVASDWTIAAKPAATEATTEATDAAAAAAAAAAEVGAAEARA